MTVSIKAARQNLATLIETARRGTPVTITKRGQEVAKLTGVKPIGCRGFPDLAEFRASLKSCPPDRTVTVSDLRRLERA